MDNDSIHDEFKMEMNDSNDDEYERILDKDLEIDCGLNIYVDSLEEVDEIDEDKLLLMDKKDIMAHKNYQIHKFKAYISSLEKEKEDLIENFKNTTNILLEKIKQKEFEDNGIRPQTAMIVDNLKETNVTSYNLLNTIRNKNKNNNNPSEIKEIKYVEIMKFDNGNETNGMNNKYERCANCKKDILKEKSIMHSLDCLRNNITCKICKELIPIKLKKEHLEEWRKKEVFKC